MTKRSRNQEIDEVGENQLGIKLRPYVVNKYDNDYGIDFIVNLTDNPDEQGKSEEPQDILSDHFFVQLKSTARFDPGTDSVHEDLKISHLEQYVTQPIPIVLAIYDDVTEEIYWHVIQEYIWDRLNSENPNWSSQQTVRIKIPRSRVITDYDRLEEAIYRAQNRINRRQNQALNIGEGIAFTPEDFSELENQAEHERLSYRGHKLLIAQQHLKQGDEKQARESVTEVLEADYDDEATVKALFVQFYMRNPTKSDEALEMAEFAHQASKIADDLGMETDRRIANIFQQVAGLFVIAKRRQEMLATARVQSTDEFETPELDYIQDKISMELLLLELGAMNAINNGLSTLLENEEYYAYAITLPVIIDYLAARRRTTLLNKIGPGGPGATPEELSPGEAHPLVSQAEQLADFVTENAAEMNLRRSISTYHYFNLDPDTATEYLTEARELAIESDDEALEEAFGDQLNRIDKVPNPYDPSQYPDSGEERSPQEMAEVILQLQGIDVDIENPPRPGESDGMDIMAYYAAQDVDPEPLYRHCKHLHLSYSPSYAGKVLGMVTFGTKYLWCQHGGFMSGPSLFDMFDRFKTEHCDGCEHHCPRADDWEFTEEFAQSHVEDPEFQSAIDRHESAIMGNPIQKPE